MQQKPKEILKHALIVFIFWWALLFWHDLSFTNLSAFIAHQIFQWQIVGIGIATGAILTFIYIQIERSGREKELLSATTRGIYSSIGLLPLHKQALVADENFSSEQLIPYIPQEATALIGMLSEWRLSQNARGNEGHTKLFDAILARLCHPKVLHLPATHADDPRHNHGGRTLLTHSLLVCYLMLRESKTYEYRPAQTASGYKHIQLKNAQYQFNPDDPLIPILGLAHDLGKIECFICNEDGNAIDCKPNHDLTGSQMISRLDEYWADSIGAQDRQFLSLIMAFYHHPSEMPMANFDSQVIDDRLHALLEMLIWCDRVASAMENNQDNLEAVREQMARDLAFDQDEDKRHSLWEAIVQVLTGNDRINTSSQSNVGRAYHLPQFGKQVIVLREDVFVQSIAHSAGMLERYHERIGDKGGNGISALTRDVLRELGRRGLLFKDHETDNRSDDSSLFKVHFYSPKEYFSDDELTEPNVDLKASPKSTWASCICMTLQNDENSETALDQLLVIEDCTQVPHLSHSRLGKQGVYTKNKPPKPQSIDPAYIRRSLALALEQKNSLVSYKVIKDGKIAIVNSDAWFAGEGLDVEHLAKLTKEELLAYGLTQAGESTQYAGQHFFVLEDGMFTVVN